MYKKKKLYLSIFTITFIISFIFITKDKTKLFNSLLNEITKKEKILNISNLLTPKEIIYSSINKSVSKNSLSVFNSIYDEFNYETSKSNYVVKLIIYRVKNT